MREVLFGSKFHPVAVDFCGAYGVGVQGSEEIPVVFPAAAAPPAAGGGLDWQGLAVGVIELHGNQVVVRGFRAYFG